MGRRGRRTFRVPIETLNIQGEEVEIVFFPQSNEFRASLLDEDFVADNYTTIVGRLRKKGKEWKPSVSIPVTKIDHGEKGGEFEDYTVTGVHSGNGNIMLRNDANGEIHQCGFGDFGERGKSSWDYERIPRYVRRLTAKDRTEFDELVKAEKAAEKAREKKQRSFAMPIRAEIARLQKIANRQASTETEAAELEGDPRVTPERKKR